MTRIESEGLTNVVFSLRACLWLPFRQVLPYPSSYCGYSFFSSVFFLRPFIIFSRIWSICSKNRCSRGFRTRNLSEFVKSLSIASRWVRFCISWQNSLLLSS